MSVDLAYLDAAERIMAEIERLVGARTPWYVRGRANRDLAVAAAKRVSLRDAEHFMRARAVSFLRDKMPRLYAKLPPDYQVRQGRF